MDTDKPEQPQEAIRFIGDMQRLELKPGDILIIRASQHLSELEFERIKALIEREFPGHKCLLFETDMEIGVLSKTDKVASEGS